MQQDSYVELSDIPVLRVKADMRGGGPSSAFALLESKLSTLKGRKFYGTFCILPENREEYYACVATIETDDPNKMDLETGVIPAGRYVRRKIINWERVIRSGQLPKIVNDLAGDKEVDSSRPTIEYYRSQVELHLLVPVSATKKINTE